MSQPIIFRGLLYKEWIKLRYLGLVPFLLLLIGSGSSFYDLYGMKLASGGQSIWTQVIFRAHMSFKSMQYLPLFSGVWLAAAQFAPECIHRRLRLFLHMPVHEQKAIFLLMGLGAGILLILSSALCLMQAYTVSLFMPAEAVRLTVLTLLPWCLAGFVSYAATVLVLIESRPVRKLWHGTAGLIFALALCSVSAYGRYINALPWFGLIAVLWFVSVSAVLDRVKRGLPW